MARAEVKLFRKRTAENNRTAENFWTMKRTVKMVRLRQKHPPFTSLEVNRVALRALLLWPPESRQIGARLRFSLLNAVALLIPTVYAVTVLWQLLESEYDFATFGEDLLFLIGDAMVLSKEVNCRLNWKDMGYIIDELNRLHTAFSRYEDDDIRGLQRSFFLHEMGMCVGFTVLLSFHCFFICIQPLLTGQDLIFRAKFPFALHDPQRHPTAAVLVNIYQTIFLVLAMMSTVYLDTFLCHVMNQVTLNLRILRLRLRKLGENGMCDSMWDDLRAIVRDHQHIIALIDKVNRTFSINYLIQMPSSISLVCLSAFGSLLTLERPQVAVKFVVTFTCSTAQLFYWCWNGNTVYFESMEIANEVYAIKNWFNESPRFQRNLMFIIMRAQKPLVFRAVHLRPFEFQTFTWLMSTSYSYFTMIRTFLK